MRDCQFLSELFHHLILNLLRPLKLLRHPIGLPWRGIVPLILEDVHELGVLHVVIKHSLYRQLVKVVREGVDARADELGVHHAHGVLKLLREIAIEVDVFGVFAQFGLHDRGWPLERTFEHLDRGQGLGGDGGRAGSGEEGGSGVRWNLLLLLTRHDHAGESGHDSRSNHVLM